MKKPSSKIGEGVGRLQEQFKQAEARETERIGARELTQLGRQLREAYAKRGKNDAVDAEAICEAGTRPPLHFVAMKLAEQHAALSLHRTRNLLVAVARVSWALPQGCRQYSGERKSCLT